MQAYLHDYVHVSSCSTSKYIYVCLNVKLFIKRRPGGLSLATVRSSETMPVQDLSGSPRLTAMISANITDPLLYIYQFLLQVSAGHSFSTFVFLHTVVFCKW